MLVFPSTTMADKKFAHSKSLDMTFTAIGEPWCQPEVEMQVAAQDAAKFETSAYTDIIRKLGHVLVRECPEATTLSIKGEVNGQPAWEGSASRAEAWRTPFTAGDSDRNQGHCRSNKTGNKAGRFHCIHSRGKQGGE